MKIQHYQFENKTETLSFADWRKITSKRRHITWKVTERDQLVRLNIVENGQTRFFNVFEREHAIKVIANTYSTNYISYVIEEEEMTDNEKIYLILGYLNKNESQYEFDSEEVVCETGIDHNQVKALLERLHQKRIISKLPGVGVQRREVFGFTVSDRTKQAFLSGKYSKPIPKQSAGFVKSVKAGAVNIWNKGLKLNQHFTLAQKIWGVGGTFIGSWATIEKWTIVKSWGIVALNYIKP